MTTRTAIFSELIADSCLAVGDGYRAKNDELGGSGPVFLRSAYLQHSGFVAEMPERFRERDLAVFGDKVARLGDVVVTTKGNSTGRIGVIRPAQTGAVYSPHLSYWRSLDRGRIDQGFLFYWSQSIEFRSQLGGMAYSTDMAPYFSLRDQNRLKISLPNIEVQRAIGRTLSALDDKIELNRRMNETLEAMAQAIFRDWFVDFGPTRCKLAFAGANAAGRKRAGIPDPIEIMGGLVQSPARAAELAALFPAALGDNGLPEGWEVKTFLNLFELKRGYDLPSKSRVPGPIPIVSSSGLTGWHDTTMAQGPGIVTGRYGTIGEVFECPTDFWPLNTTLYVCDFKGHPYWFVFHVLRGLDFRKFTDKAAVPGVNRNDIHREPLTMPPTNVQVGFESLVAPLMAKCRANREESQTLAATRDLLLPKLMSGEIRLRDAEAMAEAAQ